MVIFYHLLIYRTISRTRSRVLRHHVVSHSTPLPYLLLFCFVLFCFFKCLCVSNGDGVIPFVGIAVTIDLFIVFAFMSCSFFLLCHCMHFITVIKLSTHENRQEVGCQSKGCVNSVWQQVSTALCLGQAGVVVAELSKMLGVEGSDWFCYSGRKIPVSCSEFSRFWTSSALTVYEGFDFPQLIIFRSRHFFSRG